MSTLVDSHGEDPRRISYPAFDRRLLLAMDYAGLEPGSLWRALRAAGLPVGRDSIYKLLSGARAMPNYQLVGGIAHVAQVDVRWFYDADTPHDLQLLAALYGLAEANPRRGTRQTTGAGEQHGR